MQTLYSNTLARVALTPVVRTANAAVNGTAVDLGVFGNDFRSVLFVVSTGVITDGTHTVTLEVSADNSSWSAAATDRIQGSLPAIGASDDNTLFQFGYKAGTEQYVRIVVTTAAATSGGLFGAVAVLGEGSNNPVARS